MFQASPIAAGALLAIFGIPWFSDQSPNFCLHLHVALSLYKAIGLGHLNNLIFTGLLAKTLFPKTIMVTGTEG